MIRSRLIPLLLISEGSLVKSKKFDNYKYIGDPLNAVRIFNEKNVDELILLDISSSKYNLKYDTQIIKDIVSHCRMPVCFGGGIKDIQTVEKIISLGIEKISFGAMAFENPKLIKEAIDLIGSQSIVVVLDYKVPKFSRTNYCFTKNGKVNTNIKLREAIDKFTLLGVGEIVIQSIERDGTRKGYDLLTYKEIIKETKIPITIAGGAGEISHCIEADTMLGPVGLAAGSLFVLHGFHEAVLLTYPTKEEKLNFLSR